MSRALTGIDHAIIGVADLEAARARWARLGFNSTPRGRHVGWGTANYCIMFEHGYLELLGIVDPDGFSNGLDRLLAEGEGLLGLVAGTSDPEATHAGWAAAGLHPKPPRALGRLLEVAGAPWTLRFRNVMLDPAEIAGLRFFACTHLTPELLRRPAWLAHPNGAVGLAGCTIVARDPEPVRAAMARIFGPAALTRTDRVWAVHAGGTVILIATADDAELLHPEFDLEPDDDRPALKVLAVKVQDPDRVATFLGLQGIPFARDAAGSVLVQPEEANGVCLELSGR
jgi:hypothetical protein